MRNTQRVGLLAACVIVVAVSGMFAAAQVTTDWAAIESGYRAAQTADAPTRRFVELYLRVAGLAWVVVEWVAAAYLIVGFRMLRRWFDSGVAS